MVTVCTKETKTIIPAPALPNVLKTITDIELILFDDYVFTADEVRHLLYMKGEPESDIL